MKNTFLTICLSLFIMVTGIKLAGAEGDKDMVVCEGRKVSFDYTLTIEGEVVDSSEKEGPLEYTHGEGMIIPGLSRQMEGLRVGDEKKIKVLPEEGYGPRNPEAFREIPKSSLPEGVAPEAGMYLQMQGPGGQPIPVRIEDVKEDSIILDLNHPLSGKELVFDVKIVSIQ